MTQRFLEEMAREIEAGFIVSGTINPQSLIDWLNKVVERLQELSDK